MTPCCFEPNTRTSLMSTIDRHGRAQGFRERTARNGDNNGRLLWGIRWRTFFWRYRFFARAKRPDTAMNCLAKDAHLHHAQSEHEQIVC